MLHLIFVDNFPFAYCYGVLEALLACPRFMRDLDKLFA